MRIWSRVDSSIRSIDRLSAALVSLAAAMQELARAMKAQPR